MRFIKGVVNFMVIYRVIHKYKTDKHFEIKEIGVFDSYKKATDAIDIVKNKNGFKDYQNCFSIKKLFKLFKPALLNNIYWKHGYDTYYFDRRSNTICCDKEKKLMKYFGFLLTEYNFKFDKLELGNMVDENGKLCFYGPYNCYYFYNDVICINFLNLVQRQDWNIYITTKVLSDQNLINKGKAVSDEYLYNWALLERTIKRELKERKTIFDVKID